MRGIETLKREGAAPPAKKERKRSRKKTKGAAASVPGAAHGTPEADHKPAAAPADNSARPDEPPPSLIPPEVQAEIDRLKMVNRALRGALRSLIEDE